MDSVICVANKPHASMGYQNTMKNAGRVSRTRKKLPKQEIRERVVGDGYDPNELTYYYLSSGEPVTCNYEDLPEDLESFHCYGDDYQPWYHYVRHDEEDD